jgi:hypothetical protein
MAETFEFEPMERTQSKLSVAVYAPSGAGKTTGAIKIAMGIRNKLYPDESLKDIGLFIDTERRSSTKAVGRSIGGEVLEPLELYCFEPPFDIYKLAKLIDYAVTVKKKKIIVVDSYSAFWSGVDGILERASELDVELAGQKKMYGAWSEKEIISKKNVLKNLMTNQEAHIIMCFRAKTEYVVEVNSRGKSTPRAVGVKEDMQGDVRYEFDCVLSLDKETHSCSVVKDRIGYVEIRNTSSDPEAPITVADGEMLAKIVSEGLTLEEIAQRKVEHYINFILDEKAHKSTKVGLLENKKGMEFTREVLNTFDYDTLTKIVKYINN